MRPDRAVRRPALNASPWEAAFARALGGGDPLGASTILRGAGENGWVKRAELRRAARVVDEEIRPAPLVRRDWAERLLAHPRRVDKELAAALLLPLVLTHQREVERALLRLAGDDDWEVRETAAGLLGAALETAFDRYLPIATEWAAGRVSRLRRAAIVAAKLAARTRRPERADALLDLAASALRDRDEYVRRNLGPFAIGDGLLRSYPEPTLARLAEWSRDPDETVRWNVAMAFTSAESARHAERAVAILAFLAADQRPFVARAATAALRNVLRRRPDLRPAIVEWSGGSRPAVERALRLTA